MKYSVILTIRLIPLMYRDTLKILKTLKNLFLLLNLKINLTALIILNYRKEAFSMKSPNKNGRIAIKSTIFIGDSRNAINYLSKAVDVKNLKMYSNKKIKNKVSSIVSET